MTSCIASFHVQGQYGICNLSGRHALLSRCPANQLFIRSYKLDNTFPKSFLNRLDHPFKIDSLNAFAALSKNETQCYLYVLSRFCRPIYSKAVQIPRYLNQKHVSKDLLPSQNRLMANKDPDTLMISAVNCSISNKKCSLAATPAGITAKEFWVP